MAVMHPVDIENYDYTPTEKEMYYALKNEKRTEESVYGAKKEKQKAKTPVSAESDFNDSADCYYCIDWYAWISDTEQRERADGRKCK